MNQPTARGFAADLPPGADTPGLFYKRRIVITVVLAALGLLIALLANVFSEDRNTAAPDPTLASESALGHSAFVGLVNRLKIDGMTNLNPLITLVISDVMPVFLEPNPAEIAPVDFAARLTGKSAFVVLPKWTAIADPERPRWISKAQFMERAAVQDMARVLASDSVIVRTSAAVTYPQSMSKITPTLTRPQLVLSRQISPLISGPDGILFGVVKRGKTRIYVLSDPDLLNNHGLDNGRNSVLAIRMLDMARAGNAVEFDSSVQKFRGSISLWRQLFLPPLLGVTLLSFCAVLVLVWHVLVRLAPPQLFDAGVASGKRGLIDNSAALFDFRSHDDFLKNRYFETALGEIYASLPMVARVAASNRAQALDDLGQRCATAETYTQLAEAVASPAASVVNTARRIARWKQEIMRGST